HRRAARLRADGDLPPADARALQLHRDRLAAAAGGERRLSPRQPGRRGRAGRAAWHEPPRPPARRPPTPAPPRCPLARRGAEPWRRGHGIHALPAHGPEGHDQRACPPDPAGRVPGASRMTTTGPRILDIVNTDHAALHFLAYRVSWINRNTEFQ